MGIFNDIFSAFIDKVNGFIPANEPGGYDGPKFCIECGGVFRFFSRVDHYDEQTGKPISQTYARCVKCGNFERAYSAEEEAKFTAQRPKPPRPQIMHRY